MRAPHHLKPAVLWMLLLAPFRTARSLRRSRGPVPRRTRLLGTSFRQRVGPFSVGLARDPRGLWITWSIWGTGLRGRFPIRRSIPVSRRVAAERPAGSRRLPIGLPPPPTRSGGR